MRLKITTPLVVTTSDGTKLELLPVPMKNPYPSGTRAGWPCLWPDFVKCDGQVHPCDGSEIARVQQYMQLHETEALSEDGELAFTVSGPFLRECCPDVCGLEEDLAE
jgi:hypothetical protein